MASYQALNSDDPSPCTEVTAIAMTGAEPVRHELIRTFDASRAGYSIEDSLDLAPRAPEDRIALLTQQPITADLPPAEPRGAAAASAHWAREGRALHRRLVMHLEQAMARHHRHGLTLLNDLDHSREEMRARARACVEANRPVLTMAVAGSLENWLAVGADFTLSISLLVVRDRRLATAVITPRNALVADFGSTYRMDARGGWRYEPRDVDGRVAQATGKVLIPQPRNTRECAWYRRLDDPTLAKETGAGIADAVVRGALPVGVHSAAHVLDSAILLVAAASDFAVRPLGIATEPWCSWETAARMLTALREDPRFPQLLIGRERLAIDRLDRQLA
ncbi:hypothetical protein [Streptomyces sp. URMC 123]|uniref:hypothetical protein n=1 Tax=Streptomyces sp. URMC 123 TaxID=3423403 RepID=UPI003F1AE29E